MHADRGLAMRVRVAGSAALFWDRGKLVWDDYIGHHQHALSPDSERLLRWFSDWRDLDSARTLGDEYYAIAERLVEAGILIAEDSPEHALEQRVLANWGAWGPAARYLHLASRTLTGSRFLSATDDAELMREQARAHARAGATPELAKTHPDRPLIELPGGRPDDATWPNRTLLDALYSRRSTRRFKSDALTLAELGAILQVAGGYVDVPDQSLGPAAFKTSPSAGALHAIELYVHVAAVDDLAPGPYHFAPTRGGLEQLERGDREQRSLESVGGQPWLAEAPALILYTAVIERLQWRYRTARAYRDMLVGLGHLSQTVLLTTCAMGLGGVFATAVCDEDLERLIGVDPITEVLLGIAAVGHPGEGNEPITW
jgi:SagB-type dehydrogenase family enzyme